MELPLERPKTPAPSVSDLVLASPPIPSLEPDPRRSAEEYSRSSPELVGHLMDVFAPSAENAYREAAARPLAGPSVQARLHEAARLIEACAATARSRTPDEQRALFATIRAILEKAERELR